MPGDPKDERRRSAGLEVLLSRETTQEARFSDRMRSQEALEVHVRGCDSMHRHETSTEERVAKARVAELTIHASSIEVMVASDLIRPIKELASSIGGADPLVC